MAKTKNIDISVVDEKYRSKTSPSSKKVKGNDRIDWTVIGVPLPSSAEVQLRFDSNKLVSALILSDGGSRLISGVVKNQGLTKGDKFSYMVWFVDGNTEYCMEDPELVMDGDTPQIVPKRPRKKAAKKEAAKKKPIKKKKAKKR